MMRRIYVALLTVVLCFSFVVPVNAFSFTHEDKDTGTTFVVPSGWERVALSKEREFLDVRFDSVQYDNGMILYGSTDLWSKIPVSDRSGFKRSDIDTSFFNKAEIAEMLGVSPNSIKEVSYNGYTYFTSELSMNMEILGITANITMTQLFRCEDGWIYLFQVSGVPGDKCYADFENLMNSVNYQDTDDNNNSPVIIFVSIFIFVILILTGCFILYKKRNNNIPSSAVSIAEESQTIVPLSIDHIFCHMCGTKLPKDSNFCHACGTNVSIH